MLVLLPAAAAAGSGVVLAVLIGVNVGPNLTYVGSLATLLWRRILARNNAEPQLGEFLRLGALTVPPVLVLSVPTGASASRAANQRRVLHDWRSRYVIGGADVTSSVAVLGTGIMGAGMARSLVRAGLDVTVWNRSGDKARPLADDGAKVAADPPEAVSGADVVVTMLFDVNAVAEVMQRALAATPEHAV
ncbi:MAG: ArsB/NhaD family transporter, partial [Pseudonocardiaceae bacterium]